MRAVRIPVLISISLLAAGLAGCRKSPEAVTAPATPVATAAAVTKNGKALTPEQIRERDAYIQRALARKHHTGTTTLAAATTGRPHPAHKAVGAGSHTTADDDAKAAKRRKAQDDAEIRALEGSEPKGELTSGHFTAPGLGDPPPQPEVASAPTPATGGGARPAASGALAASQGSAGDDGAGEMNEDGSQPRGQKGTHHAQSHAHRTPARHYRPVTHIPRVNFGPTAGMTHPVHRIH